MSREKELKIVTNRNNIDSLAGLSNQTVNQNQDATRNAEIRNCNKT